MPDPSGTVRKVSFNRRFWGDLWLEALLYIATLVIGWYIWLYFTAKTSQSPAKRLLRVYILDLRTGKPASRGRVWVSEVVVKQILFAGIVGSITSGIGPFVDAGWVLFDKNRQAVHDKVGNTIVVHAPSGLPEELKSTPAISARLS